MKIKNVREPNEKEKNDLIPKLVTYGGVFAILTLAMYFICFNQEVGESLYKEANFWNMDAVIKHNNIIKIFEFIFKRDYMKSKLEGLGFCALLNLVAVIGIQLPFRIYDLINDIGLKK